MNTSAWMATTHRTERWTRAWDEFCSHLNHYNMRLRDVMPLFAYAMTLMWCDNLDRASPNDSAICIYNIRINSHCLWKWLRISRVVHHHHGAFVSFNAAFTTALCVIVAESWLEGGFPSEENMTWRLTRFDTIFCKSFWDVGDLYRSYSNSFLSSLFARLFRWWLELSKLSSVDYFATF